MLLKNNPALVDFDLAAFDLDNTLAESKQALDDEMAGLLAQLLDKKKVAIISGASFPQYEKQVLPYLKLSPAQLADLYILPTSGASLYQFKDGTWQLAYREELSPEERLNIIKTIEQALIEAKIETPSTVYGQLIEDRGTQITFSGLGSEAPLALKKTWDPDHAKKERLATILRRDLPGYSVRVGGMSSVDVNRHGIDKAYGLRRLAETAKIDLARLLYVGDALFPGGNDEAVLPLGVPCVAVAGVQATKSLLRELFTVER
jgi:HAD superfamily hydrolase (TIGR01484 family)